MSTMISGSDSMRRTAAALAGVAAVLLPVLLMLVLAGVTPGPVSAAHPVDGAPEATAADRVAAADTLPSAELEDLDGKTVNIRSVVAGPAVVNFWATWCGPCRREMPELARLHRDLADEGLEVVGIAVSSGSVEEIRSFAERHGADYLLLRTSRSWVNRHFDFFGMPLTLIVDADGRIRERLVGPQTEERLRELVEPLLAG